MKKNYNKTIWAHTLVYNEENFLWFAVMSIAKYVDKILLWDSGSTDKTVDVIKELQKNLGKKIIFREVGRIDKDEYTKIRQEMLDKTNSDWFVILDGDEVWWDESFRLLVETIKKDGDNLDAIAVPFYNAIGDIYHYQEAAAGNYQLLDRTGHLSIKAINRKINGLHVENPYGSEGYFDKDNVAIQNSSNKLFFLNAPFLHCTHLRRSHLPQKINKIKYEIGNKLPTEPPEAFSERYPSFIESPFKRPRVDQKLRMILETPFKKINRRTVFFQKIKRRFK